MTNTLQEIMRSTHNTNWSRPLFYTKIEIWTALSMRIIRVGVLWRLSLNVFLQSPLACFTQNIEIKAWKSDYINVNSRVSLLIYGLTSTMFNQTQLKLCHGWRITSHAKQWMELIFHALVEIDLCKWEGPMVDDAVRCIGIIHMSPSYWFREILNQILLF